MTVDREQIRRDAEAALRYGPWNSQDRAVLARHCLALLAEMARLREATDHVVAELDHGGEVTDGSLALLSEILEEQS